MNTFSYRNLTVWQKAIDLGEKVYKYIDQLPKVEEFNLKSQMRRAVTSVSSNIAEGSARIGLGDQGRFYIIARASLVELDSQIQFCKRLGFFSELIEADLHALSFEIYRMLTGMIGSYKNKLLC